MAKKVKAIPENFRAITPNLVLRDAARAIDFYKSVFGATEIRRTPGPGGKIMYAELRIGDSTIILNDSWEQIPPAMPESGASNPMFIHLYVNDVDAVFDAAVEDGARIETPVHDMFWGDRYGKLTDPFGQQWGIATHKEDIAPEELKRRQDALFSKAAGQH